MKIKVGMEFENTDSRYRGRTIRVVEVYSDYVVVQNITTGRRTSIDISRLTLGNHWARVEKREEALA
jgi:hypothetical protein